MIKIHPIVKLAAFAAGSTLLLTGCEPGMKETKQLGFRGTGMDLVVQTSAKLPADVIPPVPYPLEPDTGGPRAKDQYLNLQVLGDLSADQFNHLMLAITTWVAPAEQGCNYCHNPENMASDEVYTKVVARKMLTMTRTINANWSDHVKQTGVTCYTCHAGNAVPKNVWTTALNDPKSIRGNKRGGNTPDPNVGYASLNYDPFTPHISGGGTDKNIRIAGKAFPSATHSVSIQDTEGTYALMMHTSQALGVNCTYCHNSNSFSDWSQSTPQRATAWYGYRMVREINANYITPLTPVFPANRLGPAGDPYKVNCTTCHQGKNKPLGGVSMLKDYPQLNPQRTLPIAAVPITAAAPVVVGGQ